MRDFYYILGIEQNASEKQIKSSYYKLSMKFHPDKNNGDKFFEDRFKEIQEAYETLSDASKKVTYDLNLKQFNANRINHDRLQNYEQELRRKFEEELRKREETIRSNFQAKEKEIREEFARKENPKPNEQKATPDHKINITNTAVYFLLTAVLVLLIIFVVKFSNLYYPSSTPNESVASDYKDFKSLIEQWNKAHSLRDRQEFSNLFASSVLFYGEQLEKSTCIEKKFSIFQKYPDIDQFIVGDIEVKMNANGVVNCNFLKRVIVNQITTDYPSYLTFKKLDGIWQIIIEGDMVTDRNLAKKKGIHIPTNAIKGDFNGDGVSDYMWLIEPGIDEEVFDCIGECICYIKFSDPNIPSIKIENCISGTPSNEDDLNKNGGDEVGLLPGWFTSCWREYYVWTLQNGKWVNLVEPFATHCNQWDDGIKPIEFDLKREGYVIINYSEHTGEEIVTKSKSVLITK